MKMTTRAKHTSLKTFHTHHHPFLPLKYPANPGFLPIELPAPVNDEYGASISYTLLLLSSILARILGGALKTATPNNKPVANPPIWEKLSNPGNNPNTKQMIT